MDMRLTHPPHRVRSLIQSGGYAYPMMSGDPDSGMKCGQLRCAFRHCTGHAQRDADRFLNCTSSMQRLGWANGGSVNLLCYTPQGTSPGSAGCRQPPLDWHGIARGDSIVPAT